MVLIIKNTSSSGKFILGGTNGRSFASAPASSVITNGLVLYLDAGKTASYPGSGTTWTDLSGNGNHATLYNSPTFASTTNGGELIFNGSNQYGTFPTTNFPYGLDINGNYTMAPSPGTISVWAKASVASGNKQMFAYGTWGFFQARVLGQVGGTLQATFHPTDIGGGHIDTGVATPVNTWFNLTFVYTATEQVSIYKDGVLISGPTNKSLTTYNPSGTVLGAIARTITSSPFSPEYWQGSIGSILVYNRALSGTEIAQNYALQWGVTP